MLTLPLADEAATLLFGADLAAQLVEKTRASRQGLTVYLLGDLGAGKTTLVRGILRSLGQTGAVKSPTYTLLEQYQLAGIEIYHFDLYRLEDSEELEFIGARELFSGPSLRLVEWPQQAAGWLPRANLTIRLEIIDKARQISLDWQNS